MITNSPKKIIVFISVFAVVLQLLVLYLLNPEIDSKWEIILIISLSTFVLIYGLSNFLINKFFVETIYPIYKIIRTVKVDSDKIEEYLEDSSYIKNLEFEVDAWAQEKIKQIAQLRQNEKFRKEFLGDISHELKTPIFTIQGYISTLIDGGLNDPNINMKYLLRTEKSIDRMISIVEDLISISKLESGELQIHKEPFKIQSLVEDILEMQENRAQNKNISLLLISKDTDKLIVGADPKLIYQVILNLVVNSIIYGKDGGRTEVSIFDMDKYIMVDVTDDGIGISKTDIPRLFERFYRIDKSRSKEHGGTGLGLSICKHILEAHEQTITVSSNIGYGSSFSFTLEKSMA